MSSRNVLKPWRVINAVSMGASITSTPTNIQNLSDIAIQLNFTGTPTGTFAIQGSNDFDATNMGGSLPGATVNTGNWVPLDLSSTPTASGAADVILINMNGLSFPWIRIVYTRTSGTGTLNAYLGGKFV